MILKYILFSKRFDLFANIKMTVKKTPPRQSQMCLKKMKKILKLKHSMTHFITISKYKENC